MKINRITLKWGTKMQNGGTFKAYVLTHTKLTCLNVTNWNTNYTQIQHSLYIRWFVVNGLLRGQASWVNIGYYSFSPFKSRFEKVSILFSKKLLYVARQRALYVNHGAYSPVWPSRIEVHIQVRLGHGKHTSTTQTALARIHYETWSNLRL